MKYVAVFVNAGNIDGNGIDLTDVMELDLVH
ncbi:MAG: hypothetical protein II481_02465 [Clostridia bacterium]|nr:hypothetical protein [Clostridia bacterium]